MKNCVLNTSVLVFPALLQVLKLPLMHMEINECSEIGNWFRALSPDTENK